MLKLLNFFNIAVGVLLVRILYLGASVGDSFALIGLCGLYGYFLFLESKKEVPANKELKEKVNALQEELKQLQDKVGSLKMSNIIGRK
jgi:hypothetical protein